MVSLGAFALRLLLLLLTCGTHARSGPEKTAPPPNSLPGIIQAGTGYPIMPGDPNIASWGANPKHEGFSLILVKRDGKKLNPFSACAMIPDYMAAKDQPGGTLLILGQSPEEKLLDQWEVGWTGGDTLPPNTNPREFNANCGREAIVLMSTQQITDWIAILNGQPTSSAEDAEPETAKPRGVRHAPAKK